MKIKNAFVLLSFIFWGFTNQHSAQSDKPAKIVGYLPEYRINAIDVSVARYVSDIVYFSIEPKPDGELDLSRITQPALNKLQQMKDAYGIRVSISLGGWGRSSGFAAMALSDNSRRNFVANLTQYCLTNQFDGADIDWEFPANAAENAAFATLLQEIKQKFEPHGLLVSAALNSGQSLPDSAYLALDRIHIMSYDHGGQHATYKDALQDVSHFLNENIPAEKLFLGVPFYARHVTNRDEKTYAQIVDQFHPAPDVNEVNGYYFNGIELIERKSLYAIQSELGGIMIWELGQDTNGDRSLLRAINRTFTSMASAASPVAIVVEPGENNGSLQIYFTKNEKATGTWIYYGGNPDLLQDSVYTIESEIQIADLPVDSLIYIRFRSSNAAGSGRSSKIMAASTFRSENKILILNDYDPWGYQLDYIRYHTEAFHRNHYSLASADQQALLSSTIQLSDYPNLDWFSGDRGKWGQIMEAPVRLKLQDYLENGGNLFISGSNIGFRMYRKGSYDEKIFFHDYFKALCLADAPDGIESGYYQVASTEGNVFGDLQPFYFDDGSDHSYNVKSPDVLRQWDDGMIGLEYANISSTKRGAAVYYAGTFGNSNKIGHLIYFGFPFETIYPADVRETVAAKIISFFKSSPLIVRSDENLPAQFQLAQNYPNPFNATTLIHYSLPYSSRVSLKLLDLQGRLLRELVNEQQGAGSHQLKLDAGNLSSGIYWYSLRADDFAASKKLILIK